MIVSMTASKIAVILPGPLVARARRAVKRGRAQSMSAYVAQALEQKAKLDDLADLLHAMLAARRRGHGVVTSDPEDIARLDRSVRVVRVGGSCRSEKPQSS